MDDRYAALEEAREEAAHERHCAGCDYYYECDNWRECRFEEDAL